MRTRNGRRGAVAALAALAMTCCAFGGSPNAQDPEVRPIPVPAGVSLQEAVDAADAGSVLQLAAARFAGPLVVEKDLVLLGPAEITGGDGGAVVRIVGDAIEVRLEDLTIRGARGYEGHGVSVEGSSSAELLRVDLMENSWFGLSASDHAAVTLTECTLASNGSAGLMSEDYATVRLEQCAVRDNTSHGLLALHLSELTVTRTEISGSWAGLWAWDATRLYLTDTRLADNVDYGAIASNAALLVLDGSTVEGNGTHGLLFEESSRGVLHGSRVRANGVDGLFAQEDAILEIYDCEFTSNGGTGLRLSAGPCIGGFDPVIYFAGRIEGAGNIVRGPGEPDGNGQAALCPPLPGPWPAGFVATD